MALFVVGLLRFFMTPIGIPIETGGKLVSLTIVLLVALGRLYGLFRVERRHARRRSRDGFRPRDRLHRGAVALSIA